jgi:hypothetical protein
MAVEEQDKEDTDHLIGRWLCSLLQGQGDRAIHKHELSHVIPTCMVCSSSIELLACLPWRKAPLSCSGRYQDVVVTH